MIKFILSGLVLIPLWLNLFTTAVQGQDTTATVAKGKTWTLAELDTLKDRKWVWRDRNFDEKTLGDLSKNGPPDEMPMRETTWKPDYPSAASKAKAEGSVWVRLLIDEAGKVRVVHILEDTDTHYGFEEAAIEVAKKSHWTPAEKDGKKIAIWVAHEVRFRLVQTEDGLPVTKLDKWDWQVGDGHPYSGDYKTATEPDSSNNPAPTQFVFTDQLPSPVKTPYPRYPEGARQFGIEGTVTVKVLIGIDGHVKRAMVIAKADGKSGFEEAALTAAIDATWKPATLNGHAVAVWVSYPIRFRLRG